MHTDTEEVCGKFLRKERVRMTTTNDYIVYLGKIYYHSLTTLSLLITFILRFFPPFSKSYYPLERELVVFLSSYCRHLTFKRDINRQINKKVESEI